MIAPGAYRNKMNARVRNKSRELEKMKRDLVSFLVLLVLPLSIMNLFECCSAK